MNTYEVYQHHCTGGPSDSMPILAEEVRVEHGDLLFRIGGKVVCGFASGEWSNFCLRPPVKIPDEIPEGF
jgi:hypothetical protein